ncbi:hypothetical protein [Ferdinandcohnia sp. Marseille-Q9671]
MSKYVSIFFLTLLICIVLFFAILGVFGSGESYVESAVYTFSTIIIILQASLLALICYLIDLVKKRK